MLQLEYLWVFLQATLLEFPIYWLFFRRRLGPWRILALVTLANLCTHPVVFFGIMAMKLPLLANILIAQLFAITTEATLDIYAGGIERKRAFLAALAANVFAWQTLPILTYYLV